MQYAMFFDELESGEDSKLKKICVNGLTVALAAFVLLSVTTYLLVGCAAEMY